MRFDSCFDGDTVSLYLNNNEIFKNFNLKTNDIVSLTPVHITYLNNGIIQINDEKNNILEKKMDLNNYLDIKIIVNDNETNKIIEISKGKNITIDRCTGDYKVNIHQYKKKVVYD